MKTFTVKDFQTLECCRVDPVCREWMGSFVNAISDSRSVVCVRSYDLEANARCHDGIVRATVDAPFEPVGKRAGFAAGPREGFRERLKAMTIASGAPRSEHGGAWSMDSDAARRSYVFARPKDGDIGYWIDFVKRAGFSHIHIVQGWTTGFGHYPINPDFFPGGMDQMKEAAANVHAAGLTIGIHTLTGCISFGDGWMTPECSDELISDLTYTLSAPLAGDATEMTVEELPDRKHSLVMTYSSRGNAFRIGKEIVQYSGIRREKPYAFTGLQRGAFGTKKGGTYPAGTKAEYLHQLYNAFYPAPGSALAGKLADRIAEIYDYCDMDEVYLDGSEGMGTRYAIDWMRHAIFSRCGRKTGRIPMVEASCGNANNWWFQTRTGTCD
ncbi:MAG TPA: hypothetical protein PKI32_09090, partial [Opitutales bacterium]|nr:hypothetical protein [Opitutales bacterium]